MTRNLRGAVVVITGSARGIGAATAVAFRDAGAKVVIADIDDTALTQAEERIKPALAMHLDVTQRSEFEDLFSRVEADLGPVDILVNNAGIMPVAEVTEISDAMAARVIEINFMGTANGTRAALARMLPRGRGHIINLSSMLGEMPGPFVTFYCASKFAVVGFTDAARMELRGKGIDLSLVLPGQADTELTAGLTPMKGFSLAKPEAIAVAVVKVARRPRRRIYVPWTFGVFTKINRFFPRAVYENALALVGANDTIKKQDSVARRAYDQRAMTGRSD